MQTTDTAIILSRSETESLAEGDTRVMQWARSRAREQVAANLRWRATCVRSEKARAFVGAEPLRMPPLRVDILDADRVYLGHEEVQP